MKLHADLPFNRRRHPSISAVQVCRKVKPVMNKSGRSDWGWAVAFARASDLASCNCRLISVSQAHAFAWRISWRAGASLDTVPNKRQYVGENESFNGLLIAGKENNLMGAISPRWNTASSICIAFESLTTWPPHKKRPPPQPQCGICASWWFFLTANNKLFCDNFANGALWGYDDGNLFPRKGAFTNPCRAQVEVRTYNWHGSKDIVLSIRVCHVMPKIFRQLLCDQLPPIQLSIYLSGYLQAVDVSYNCANMQHIHTTCSMGPDSLRPRGGQQ